MNGFLKLLSLCLFLTLTVPLQAVTNGVANEPDSVYLFSYSHADGSGGLKLAWSPDGNRWFSVADGNSFVNSDFGPWGLDLIEYANGDARRTVWGGGTGCAHGRRTLLRGPGLDDSQSGLLGKVRIKD